jgi:hypothetical protein
MKTPLVFLFCLVCCAATAQQSQSQTQYPTALNLGSAPSQTNMTVNDVIKLSHAKLSDDVIVQQLSKKGLRFSLSTEQLIELKNAGVSDRVIQAMIDPTNANAPSLKQNTQTAAPQQPKQPTDPSPAVPEADLPPGAHAFAATPVVAPQPLVASTQSANGPRVYFESASKGSQWNAARNQSMEMSKDFEKDCPSIKITINQATADYTILLNHIEHGFVRDNQIQVANKDGDLISRTKEGGSIRGDMKKACQLLLADWNNKPR